MLVIGAGRTGLEVAEKLGSDGIANENFPRHTGGAIVLDGIGYLDQYMAEDPEGFLAYCDWMGIPMQAYPVSLDRFKRLLSEGVENLAP